jgi:hypothetical protein
MREENLEIVKVDSGADGQVIPQEKSSPENVHGNSGKLTPPDLCSEDTSE